MYRWNLKRYAFSPFISVSNDSPKFVYVMDSNYDSIQDERQIFDYSIWAILCWYSAIEIPSATRQYRIRLIPSQIIFLFSRNVSSVILNFGKEKKIDPPDYWIRFVCHGKRMRKLTAGPWKLFRFNGVTFVLGETGDISILKICVCCSSPNRFLIYVLLRPNNRRHRVEFRTNRFRA